MKRAGISLNLVFKRIPQPPPRVRLAIFLISSLGIIPFAAAVGFASWAQIMGFLITFKQYGISPLSILIGASALLYMLALIMLLLLLCGMGYWVAMACAKSRTKSQPHDE
jgi:TRAP-type C4-dicarboxylate transport system permease small subunit